jgi:thermitase
MVAVNRQGPSTTTLHRIVTKTQPGWAERGGCLKGEKGRFQRLLVVLLLLGLFLPLEHAPAASAVPPAPGRSAGPEHVPGEIIVELRAGARAADIAAAAGMKVRRPLQHTGLFLLEFSHGREVAEVLQAVRRLPGVAHAEPNWVHRLHDVPNDGGYAKKWDLRNEGSLCEGSDCATAGADIDWQGAFSILGHDYAGAAVIAVLDSGIDLGHPDLSGKLTAARRDFIGSDNDPADEHGHGTHVAGIALAMGHNGPAVPGADTVGVGFGPNIRVMPLRACGANGSCSSSAMIDAMDFARQNGANVITMSYGRTGSSNLFEEQAINRAWNAGLVLVASAGNENSATISYPAAYARVIAVGATNWKDQRAPYSNYGSGLGVVAPGGELKRYQDSRGIYSTMPMYPVWLTTNFPYNTQYDHLQGTSMAAPQVAGLAGLLMSLGKTNGQARSIIETTADDLGPAGWDQNFGHGRVNVLRALTEANPDVDADGFPDLWELAHFGNCRRDGSGDFDGDGLTDREEFILGTSPVLIDTDGDGTPDGWEVLHGLDPLADDAAGDLDGDGFTNLEEFLAGSDPSDLSSTPPVLPVPALGWALAVALGSLLVLGARTRASAALTSMKRRQAVRIPQ